ncbi:MAG: 3-hydroxyacyl-CoA dehydrogenase NAD-binding domain-containing protein, partial [Pirellulales bacterium]|nr:3-hydroxyacyl-CoA dehydrogenase NAD-binding domain-containing protein [Pirellulales bacterium]
RRVFSDDAKAQYGFPEVKIGLYPGWGGTCRTPRIVGLANAIEMVTSSENVDGKAAALMNLATDVVPRERIEQAAIDLIRAEQQSGDYLKDRETWNGPIDISDTELMFLGATASAVIQQQTKGHYPAPVAALELMLECAALDINAAAEAEARGMAKLFGTPINQSLVNIFFLTDRNKKDPGVAGDITPAAIESVSVIGAGIMGAGIASANVKRKLPVALADALPDSLAGGVQNVLEEVSYNRETKKADIERTMEFAPLLNATTSDSEIAASDVVIEAIIENADIKRQLYERLEPQMHDDAILGSNTSTIPITSLAANLKHPERFCGIHFFNPVRRMKLIEVIRGEATSDQTVATVVAYAKQIGKMPIVVNDGPGFLVNRLLLPYMGEAIELLHDGVDIKRLDRIATGFGMPMGPITLYDV